MMIHEIVEGARANAHHKLQSDRLAKRYEMRRKPSRQLMRALRRAWFWRVAQGIELPF